jgi:hypothetical protein
MLINIIENDNKGASELNKAINIVNLVVELLIIITILFLLNGLSHLDFSFSFYISKLYLFNPLIIYFRKLNIE